MKRVYTAESSSAEVGARVAVEGVAMSIVYVIWSKLELALRLSQAIPTVETEDAFAHASAAVEAATPELPPELLVAMAYVESRFDPTWVSRIEGTKRRTAPHPSRTPPPRMRGSLFCGPLQTYAKTWNECLAMRDLATGYGAAVAELENWLKDRRVRGNVTRALRGHGCGNHGVTTGACNKYDQRVLALSRRIRSVRPAPTRASS